MLLMLLALILFRDHHDRPSAILGAIFALCIAGIHTLTITLEWGWRALEIPLNLLIVANPVAFWLLSKSLFKPVSNRGSSASVGRAENPAPAGDQHRFGQWVPVTVTVQQGLQRDQRHDAHRISEPLQTGRKQGWSLTLFFSISLVPD